MKLLLAYFWPMVILPEPQTTLDEALKRPANLAFVRKHWSCKPAQCEVGLLRESFESG